MLYKLLQGLVDIPIGEFVKYTRNGVHFQLYIHARTKCYEFSFFPSRPTVASWNELSSDTLLAQNLAMFKQSIATIDHATLGLLITVSPRLLSFTVTNSLVFIFMFCFPH